MYKNVNKTKDGFFRCNYIPTEEEVRNLYEEDYFIKTDEKSTEKNTHGNYKKTYTSDEIIYMNNEFERIYTIEKKFNSKSNKSILDIGCGEGYCLNFFYKKYHEVIGLDFNRYACESHNKDISDKVMVGDFYKTLDKLINEEKNLI